MEVFLYASRTIFLGCPDRTHSCRGSAGCASLVCCGIRWQQAGHNERKVTRVEWMNPHAFFYVDVKDEKTGQVSNWGFELNSPNYLMRSGWTKNSLKVDDLVTVTGALSRDGNKQVNASTVKMQATGKVLFAGSSDPNAPR